MADDSREQQLTARLRQAGHALYHRAGGGQAQDRVLEILLQGPVTQRELTEKLQITPASASELVTKLEKKEMLQRVRSPEDRRHRILMVTEHGKQVLAFHRSIPEQGLYEALTGEEQELLAGLLDRLLASWRGGNDSCG